MEQISAVPEPGGIGLLILGSSLLVWRGTRNRVADKMTHSCLGGASYIRQFLSYFMTIHKRMPVKLWRNHKKL